MKLGYIAQPFDRKANHQFIEQTKRTHFYTPFGVVHSGRPLALPKGEPRVRAIHTKTERIDTDTLR